MTNFVINPNKKTILFRNPQGLEKLLRGCLVYYPICPTAGNVLDKSMNGRDGTPTGLTPIAKKLGVSGFTMNGSTSKITIPTLGGISTSITIMGWTKTFANNQRYTLWHCASLGFEINNPGGGTNPGAMGIIQPGVAVQAKTNDSILDTNLHHVVYIKRGAGATNEFYIDSVLVSAPTNASWDLTACTTSHVGARDGVSQFFTGEIYCLRIYNRALLQNEITFIYNVERKAVA